MAQLIEYNKKFLIIGPSNAIIYKKIFPLIKNNIIWLGYNHVKTFLTPEGTTKSFGNVIWFTNLSHKKRNEKLILYKKYYGYENNYPKYDNYDAIEVNKVADIPVDYKGVMGVPITFLEKYNPEQFEILDCGEPCIDLKILKQNPKFKEYKSRQIICNGVLCQKTYHRLFIKNREI